MCSRHVGLCNKRQLSARLIFTSLACLSLVMGMVAVSEPAEAVEDQYWALPHPTTMERRRLSCHTTAFLHTIKVCGTHIVPEPFAHRDNQIAYVRDQVNLVSTSSWATAMGGDFNSTPKSVALDRIYSRFYDNAYGIFNEVAQGCGPTRCGAATHSLGKIDYIFLGARWCCPGTSVGTARVSDHKVLRGTALLQA